MFEDRKIKIVTSDGNEIIWTYVERVAALFEASESHQLLHMVADLRMTEAPGLLTELQTWKQQDAGVVEDP